MAFNYRFSVIPAGAIVDARLSPRALQVLCLLGRHTNDAGWCSRSQVKMARELDCGRATIYDALELLVETGWIEKKANGRGGRAHQEGEQPFAAYSYRVVLDREAVPVRLTSEDHSTSDSEIQSIELQEGAAQAAEGAAQAAGGAAQAAGGAAQAAGGAAPEPAPLEGLPSEGISSEPERETARARDHEKFAKWLSAFTLRWPTAAADDQARIANAARGLSEAERNDALERIPAFLDHLVKLKRKHTPAGWNYLEQKRWTLLEQAQPKPQQAVGFVPEGSEQFVIWDTIYKIAREGRGFPPHKIVASGAAFISRELPSSLLAMTDAACEWRQIEEGTGQFAAWLRWLHDLMPPNLIICGKVGERRVLRVPFEWPPRKDGSIGPPQSESQSAA